ncbi:hypothetical protein [Photobacterium damselae]|nr:hypothetical protein [Photobacterium damselae]
MGSLPDNVSRAYDQFAARELTLSTTHLEEANVRQQKMMRQVCKFLIV